jgi:hypothetical protein
MLCETIEQNNGETNTESNRYWVSMTDKFMSGWGGAKNRIAKFVIECNTYEEAETVAENAKHRTDMKNVNICYNKPRYNKRTHQTSYRTKTESPNWFVTNYFKKDD